MINTSSLANNLTYLTLLFALIVIPRALQRFRLPAPLTSFGLGMLAAVILGADYHDPTLILLAALGISSLFLFAGLEIDVASLKRGRWPMLMHLALRSAVLFGLTFIGVRYFELDWKTAALLALALLTPSTGFILESLPRMGLGEEERYWVTIKAVGGEILALVVLFIVVQSDSMIHLGASTLALLGMIIGIPVMLKWLARLVIPHAPGSEFSLLS